MASISGNALRGPHIFQLPTTSDGSALATGVRSLGIHSAGGELGRDDRLKTIERAQHRRIGGAGAAGDRNLLAERLLGAGERHLVAELVHRLRAEESADIMLTRAIAPQLQPQCPARRPITRLITPHFPIYKQQRPKTGGIGYTNGKKARREKRSKNR